MRFARSGSILALVLGCSSFAFGSASTVTVEKSHLCCNSCVKGVEKAVASVKGASAACDKEKQTITITAPDDATAQKAVDALADAGYHGEAKGATIADNSGAPAGKVKAVTVSGIHNCCGKCTTAINNAIKKVKGASAQVPSKAETFDVTGDFEAKDLVKALNDAGFHPKVAAK